MGEIELSGGSPEELERALARLQEFLEHWRARDWEAVRARYHPQVRMHPPPGWPEMKPVDGVDAAITRWRDVNEPLEEMDVEVLRLELTDPDPDALTGLFEFIWRGRAAASGLPFELRMIQAFRFRDGLMEHQLHFYDLEEARASARDLASQ